MTNKEAIKILKEQQAEFNDEYIDYGGVNEAYNLAIEALEINRGIPKIYKCPKCLYVFSGINSPDKCPNCGATMGAENEK